MKRSKYGAIKTEVDGIKFDSKAEARRYGVLKLEERLGIITELKLQPRYDLIVEKTKIGFYKADFEYYRDEAFVLEDVKGMKTPAYNLKKKLIKAIYGIDIYETK